MVHWKAHRSGDEAQLTGAMMQLESEFALLLISNGDHRSERHTRYLAAAVGMQIQRRGWLVNIVRDHEPLLRSEPQIRQHVTPAERTEEQLLWIPSVNVSTEGRVCRGEQRWLPGNLKAVAARVLTKVTRSRSCIASPGEREVIVELPIHALTVSLPSESRVTRQNPLS